MPTEPDTSGVVADIARGRACWQAGHERDIERLTADLERERAGRARAYTEAHAAQQGLMAIATALGVDSPIDPLDGGKVDVMPILDRLAKPTTGGTGADAFEAAPPKNPAEAIQESLKNLDPEAIQAQLREAFGPVKAFFDEIRAAGERLQEKNRQGRG